MADVSVQALRTRRGRAAAVALGLAVVGACSGGGGGSTSSQTPTSSTQSSASTAASSGTASSTGSTSSGGGELRLTTDDPCKLVTQEQADALVGVTTQVTGQQSASQAGADPAGLKAIGINADGAAVTLSVCAHAVPSDPNAGFGVSIYTLSSGQTGDFSTAAAWSDDVSSRFGVPAIQNNGSVVSGQLGWTLAIIDKTHVLLTTAKQNPELCLRAMDQVLANLR